MAKRNLELFDSEWAILQAVWDNEPCAAPTVREALEDEKGWAYTTVKTMMDRMVKKGLLSVKKIRNLHLYSAVVTRREAQGSEIARTLKRAFNGALTPMMQFLVDSDQVSSKDYAAMEEFIKESKRSVKLKRKKK